MFLVSASFVSLGIALASWMTDPHGFQLIMNFVIMPVFFLSGALFPLEHLPRWLEILTLVNPLSYGVDGMRFALGGPYRFSPLLDLAVLVVFWLAMTVVGAVMFRKMSA
jgi:ABC-2 type transport system permease protein